MDQDQSTRNQWVSELSEEERDLFFMLPDWHRQVFINYPCPWERLEKRVFGDVTPKSPDDIGNKQLVVGSIRMVLTGDEEAVRLWFVSERARELDFMNEEMPISLLVRLVFPLIAYFERADVLEYLISVELQKEVVNINELRRMVDASPYLGTEGIICLYIWEKYLHDKEEYCEFHKNKQRKIATDYKNDVLNSIFGNSIEDKSQNPPQPTTSETPTEPNLPLEPNIEALHPGNTKPKRQTRERLQVLCKCHDGNLSIEEILSECKRECPDLFDKYTLDTFSKGTGNLWQLAQGYELIPRRK